MHYLGSKNRIAHKLLPIILKDRKPGQHYVELFCGGCNMLDKVENPRIAADKNERLIGLWKALQSGRCFPNEIDSLLYYAAKDAYRSSDYCLIDEDLCAWVGFMASFRAKFFAGYSGASSNKYIRRATTNILAQLPNLLGVDFVCGSYRDVVIPDSSIIYLDPPYRDTTGYSTGGIDYEDFYDFCRELYLEGHSVFISEYWMPDDFVEVFSCELRGGIKADKTGIEKLYTL